VTRICSSRELGRKAGEGDAKAKLCRGRLINRSWDQALSKDPLRTEANAQLDQLAALVLGAAWALACDWAVEYPIALAVR
jgi:hypothetical protein